MKDTNTEHTLLSDSGGVDERERTFLTAGREIKEDECRALQQADVDVSEAHLSLVAGGAGTPVTLEQVYGLINDGRKGTMGSKAAICQVATGTILGFGGSAGGHMLIQSKSK